MKAIWLVVPYIVSLCVVSGSEAFECFPIDDVPDTRRYSRFLDGGNEDIPRTVGLIYFAPNDTTFREEVVTKIKREIQFIQGFYAEQLTAHGHPTTFRVETDGRGNPKVHKVIGQHPEQYYHDNGVLRAVIHELEGQFDFNTRVYLVVVEMLFGWNKIDGADGRGGKFGKTGGIAIVADEYWLKIGTGAEADAQQVETWRNVIAHELGHAFGLEHDFRDDSYLMSYGKPDKMSMCAIDFLTVHPYFNVKTPFEQGAPPTVNLVSSSKFPKGVDVVEVQVGVDDIDGIHQVSMFVQTAESHYAHDFWELKECQNVSNEKNVQVAFNYDGIIPSDPTIRLSDSTVHFISVRAVDAIGNITDSFFNLIEKSIYHIATLNGGVDCRKIAISHDNQHFAVSVGNTVDAKVNVWDIDTLQIIGTPQIERPPERSWQSTDVVSRDVAFSPNGILATCAIGRTTAKPRGIQLWQIPSLRLIKQFGTHNHEPSMFEFLPDGKRIMVSDHNMQVVKIWDTVTEENVFTFHHHNQVSSIACSPDEQTIASSIRDDSIIRLWDVNTGNVIKEINTQKKHVSNLNFSPDGQLLTSGHLHTFKLWDVRSGNNIFTTDVAQYSGVGGISFYPDGSAVAFGDRSEIKLLDLKTWQIVEVFGNRGRVGDLVISSDGSVMIAIIRADEDYYEQIGGTPIELWDMSWWGHQVQLREIFKIEDINTDSVVDIQDLILVASRLGNEGVDLADINKDGVVDIRDLILVANELPRNVE